MTIHQHIAAGIDLGSNTFRLLVADCTAGSMKVLAKRMATVRLGQNLKDNGLLHEGSMQKGLAVLHDFRETLDHYKPQTIRICGTEALRQAENSKLFLYRAEEILQHAIEIIKGEEEAHLSFAGALSGYREPSSPLLLVDVGGGSTEFLFARSPAEEIHTISVPLGVVSLTERFLASSQPHMESLDRLLAETLSSALDKMKLVKKQSVLIIGCGGTATSMAALDHNLTSYNESLVHGHMLQSTSIGNLWQRLVALPADERNALPCLGEGRGEILPAGIRIYHVLLKLLQQDRMMVSDTGLLEGILLSSLSNDR
ncbi:MAG: Ppx/GppA family phosphatase [Deltaproteobacteria bacterium]|nr:MAG: Ppx/GppA family phosphatase [Deltaproteobacteria bacterium]